MKKYHLIVLVLIIVSGLVYFFTIKNQPSVIHFSSMTQDLLNMGKKNCDDIQNTYIQFVCVRRTTGRPHMNLFITTQNDTSIDLNISEISESCNMFDQYTGLYCIYTEAAKISKNCANFRYVDGIC